MKSEDKKSKEERCKNWKSYEKDREDGKKGWREGHVKIGKVNRKSVLSAKMKNEEE